jgi:hypothetical protein
MRAIEMVTQSVNARLGATVDPALIKAEVEAEFASRIGACQPLGVGRGALTD